jgi:hypothetical protein
VRSFAFYGRVSSDDAQDPSLSIPRQLSACERAVAASDGEIVAAIGMSRVVARPLRIAGKAAARGATGSRFLTRAAYPSCSPLRIMENRFTR